MKNKSEDITLVDKKSLSNVSINNDSVKQLATNMMDQTYYQQLLDVADREDEENYSRFSDLEMIYLYVHQERDQDEKKNKSDETKKEYLRELLWTYQVFIQYGEELDFHSIGLDVYTGWKNVKRRNIRKYQEWLKQVPLGKGGKPYSIATISRKTSIFKSFLAFLYDKKYIEQPLHESFKSANIHRRDRPNRDIYADEVIQLLDFYKDHPILHGFISVLFTTGARIREICTARICDLSYDKEGYWLEVVGKGNEKRELFLYPNVFDTIVTFRKRRGLDTVLDESDKSPIFVTAKQKPYTYKYLSNYLTKAINKTDLPFIKNNNRSITPHTLRHGFAIESAEQGTDIYRIMQSLGHKKMETTMIYLEKHAKRKNHAAHNWKDSTIISKI